MMRNGVCSKCNAPTVHMARNGVHFGERAYVSLMPHQERGPGGMLRAMVLIGHPTADVFWFACVTCGHIEMNVFGPQSLGFIQSRWAKVPVQR